MRAEIHNVGGTCTTLVAIYGNNIGYPMSAIILNEAAGTIYTGHKGVTSLEGFPIKLNEFIEVDLVNEDLWAIATVTCTVKILRRGDA